MDAKFITSSVARTLRRPAVAGSAVAALGVGLCLWGGERWAKGRVEQSLASKLRAPVAIESLSLGFGSQDVWGIHIGSRDSAIEAFVRHVRVSASPWSLLVSGKQGIDRVEIDTAKLTLRTHRVTPRAIDKANQHAVVEQRNHLDSKVPALTARILQIALQDEQGQWASGQCAHAEFADGHLHLSSVGGELQDGAANLSVSDMELDAHLSGSAIRLTGGHIGRVRLQGDPDAGSVLALARTRRAASRLRQMLPSHQATSTTQTHSDTSSPPAWTRWLAPGAKMKVKQADLAWVHGTAKEPLLQNASLEIGSQEEGQVTSTGHATAASGGSIAWDATLGTRPLEVRADVKLKDAPLSLLEGAAPQLPWYRTEDGRLSANLRLRTQGPQRVNWEGELRVLNAALSSPRIAPEPVTGIQVALTGRGAFSPLDRALEIEEGRLQIGDAEVELVGSAVLAVDHYQLNIDASLPSTPCAQTLTAIPLTLLGDLRNARLAGKISGQINLRLDSQALQDTTLELHVKDRCDFVDMTAMADLRRFRQPFTHTVVEPDDSVFQMETGPGSSSYAYLEDISPFFVNAVLAHEDARFFSHGGFSPPHIRDALVRNLQEKRYVVGASTISMQLVKNLLLHREKTLARKLQEVLLTWYMERTMDKRDIIELYLNVIEYGPAVYGIRHAAQHYFGRTPLELSPAESAFLATILPSPKRYHEYYERGSLSTSGAERVRTLLRRLAERGSCDEATVAYGLSELEHFHFVKEGEVAPPRVLEGKCAPLPYQTGFESSSDWDLFPTNQVYEHVGQFP